MTALTVVLLAVTTARAADDLPNLDWIDRDALAAGEVLVRGEKGDRPLSVLVRVATRVNATPQAIWNVLTACLASRAAGRWKSSTTARPSCSSRW
jgi:hypothetical protein